MKSKYIITAALFASILFSSCQKEKVVVSDGEPLVLTADLTEVELQQTVSEKDAISFSWTSGTNYKTGNAITYTFEFDRAGNDFKGGYKTEIGKTTDRNLKYTHGGINTMILEKWTDLEYGKFYAFEARITATVVGTDYEPQVSVMNFKLAPYREVFDHMYIAGPACKAGVWDLSEAEMMEQQQEEGHFTYSGVLNAGEMKYVVSRNGFDRCFVRADMEDKPIELNVPQTFDIMYRYVIGKNEKGEDVFNCDDNKWILPSMGKYEMDFDYSKLKVTITLTETQDPLFITGSANGSKSSPVSITKDINKFRFNGLLMQGTFHFESGKPVSKKFYKGADDNTLVEASSGTEWNVPLTAFYTLDIDMGTNHMDIMISTIDNIWMIGDATPGGWDWDLVTSLTRVEDGVFSYNGPLSKGEIKFPLEKKSDWTGLFIVAPTAGMPAPASGIYEITSTLKAENDKKWKITANGNYIVTINLNEGKIYFEQQ